MANPARARSIEQYSKTFPALTRQLDFFSALWAVQDRFEEQAATYEPADQEKLHTALKQHQTLLSLAKPTIPLDAYREAVTAIAELMAADAGLPEEQAAALAAADIASAISDEALKDALSGFDAFVRSVASALDDTRISDPLLSFILTEAMTPFVRPAAKAAVDAVGKFDWLQWDSGLCPACGTPASSGLIRDEGELQGGRRWLSCPLCRTQWEYARLRCARCGSRNHQDLEYLFDEQDPGHRVHTCLSCHGYTVIALEKDLKLICIPEVEEVVMVPLEAVAADKGFTPLGDQDEPTPQ